MAPIYVGSRGPRTAKIMIVGDAPSAQDEKDALPFMGGAGELLSQMLSSVGAKPTEIFYTNLSKYRAPGNKFRALLDDNGLPGEQLLSSLAELREEIMEVRPNVIIPVGVYSLKFLTGKGRWVKNKETKQFDYTGIGDYRGSILEGTGFTGGTKCVPTYSPTAVLQQYELKHIARLDLRRALEQSQFPEIRRPSKHIVIEPQGIERTAWLDWLKSVPGTLDPTGRFKSAPFLTADIEYVGSRLLCLGATRNADVAVVFRTTTNAAVAEMRDLMLSGVPLCFQNGMFDCSILEWFYDIPCIQYLKHDTMIGMHVSYTEFPKDLGFIGSIFTEQPVWWDKVDWKAVEAGRQTIEETMEYNAIDVWVTHDSMEKMLADELADPMLLSEYEYEMSLVKPLWIVSKRGVKIDVEGMTQLKATLTEEASLLLQGLQHLNGGQGMNPKSGPQVRKFLFERLGLPKVGGSTKTGAMKTDDQTMADLLPHCKTKEQIAAVKMIRRCRENLDLISKFCNIELDDDGRMRCHYDPAKTVTSRLSSRKFYPTKRGANLQNIPKDGRVRRVFIADTGMFFGYADLKSAESMVVAHITGDREMLRLHSAEYMDGTRDGHKFVASFLLDKPIEAITSDDRYLGKKCRHALNYIMGWYRLMKNINKDADVTGVAITAAQAKQFIMKYLQLHPDLKPWWDGISYQLRTTHKVTTLLGRVRTFYGRADEVLPEAIAFAPQGTVAKALNLGLLRAADDPVLADLGFQILLQVHDAIGYQAPVENLHPVNRRLMELMRVEIPITRRGVEPYTITIPVDIKVGLNWGEWSAKNPDLNPNGLREWHDGTPLCS